ncbi:hypothetical protein BTJ68_10865 [Hortaea werneckii EXF-2000]|uniref:Uncharacterized protein n=2 Tax=Hortaea werneckii TaxID=91943 RepID=A0A3M7JB00_HORWE|nr:hypothetical protein BTJ68_10865 [Hortaea werneckii EXF-2000]RMZ34945.1 hypothetical protein D0859_00931 [Hortaea werneckii]
MDPQPESDRRQSHDYQGRPENEKHPKDLDLAGLAHQHRRPGFPLVPQQNSHSRRTWVLACWNV